MAEVPVSLNAKHVVKKHIHAGLYGAFPYTLAVNLAHIPLAFVETIVYGFVNNTWLGTYAQQKWSLLDVRLFI